MRANSANPGQRDEKAEERETWDGLHDIGKTRQPWTHAAAMRDPNASWDRDGYRDGHRQSNEENMLPGQRENLLSDVSTHDSAASVWQAASGIKRRAA
jgi:hypothetical protein